VQRISKYPLVRLILGLITVILIAAAIALELLPEDEAKAYVIPVLVAALFSCVSNAIMYRNH